MFAGSMETLQPSDTDQKPTNSDASKDQVPCFCLLSSYYFDNLQKGLILFAHTMENKGLQFQMVVTVEELYGTCLALEQLSPNRDQLGPSCVIKH
jgi:hypothetical protein